MMPEIKVEDAHCEIDRVDFIKRGRAGKKIKSEDAKKDRGCFDQCLRIERSGVGDAV